MCDRSLDLWGGAVREHTVNGRRDHSRLGTWVRERPSGAKKSWSVFHCRTVLQCGGTAQGGPALSLMREKRRCRSRRTRSCVQKTARRSATETRFKSWTPFNLIQNAQSWKINGGFSLAGGYIKITLILNKTAQNDARRRPMLTVSYTITVEL